MSKNIRKSLCICAAALLLGGIVAPSISNYSVSAHRRHHITRIRKYHRSHKSRKVRKNRINYRTYKYNLRKYNQYQRNLKKARRSFNYYKKLLRHKHSRRLMRKYTNSKRYWQKQINQLTKSSYRYQRVIKQYKNGRSFKITIKHPHDNKRSRVPNKYRRYKEYENTNVRVIKPKVHKLAVHHKSHHVKRNLADDTHKYILSTNDMISDNSLNNILNDKGYQYGGGSIGDLVHIINQETIDGKTFDYIKDPGSYDNNKWIYDGELSENSNDSSNDIDLNTLEQNIYSNKVNSLSLEALQQDKQQTLTNINSDRIKYGVPKLAEYDWLDNIAGMRAKQLASHFSHYTSNGLVLNALDAVKLGYYPNYQQARYHISENIVSGRLFEPYHINANYDVVYHDHNGYDLANSGNNYFMYDDADHNWGHRKNILNPSSVAVGIGTYYDSDNNTFYTAENFSNTTYYDNEINNNSTTNANNNNNNDQSINDNGNGTQGNNGIDNGQTNNYSNSNNAYNGNNFDDYNNNDDINNYGYSDGNNNTILSTSDGAVIDHGSNNTINAKGSVIVNGYNNTINSKGIVIANGYNNTVNAKKTIWNDTDTNDGNYQEALANGIAINASNMNGQNISK